MNRTNILTEGNIQFDFTRALSARKFDDSDHGLSHCMKAVDFIVETKARTFFVEVKDPQHPSAKRKNIAKFIKEMQSKKLIAKDLTYKGRDSYLYEWASDNIKKPVLYLVLIALDTLTSAELIGLTDKLKQHIPVDGPSGKPWPRKFIHSCVILNLAEWNRRFAEFPATRI